MDALLFLCVFYLKDCKEDKMMLKKTSFFILLLIIALLSACDNQERESESVSNSNLLSENTVLKEGVYFLERGWRELTSEEKTHAPIAFEEAFTVAIARLEEQQQSGYFQNYILQSVFYDTEDEVWIFSFSEPPLIPGICYNIAISRVGGHLLGEWGGE